MKHYVEEIFELVGKATVTSFWDENGVFKEQEAIKIADRLCDIVREQKNSAYQEIQREFATKPDSPHRPGRTRVRV